MGAFIKWLIGWPWCSHRWDILRCIRVFEKETDQLPTGHRYILKCEKCGDLKQREVRG